MGWAETSRAAIMRVHASLPEGATPAERKRALREAYPFAQRSGYAYKAWLREQRKYLARFPDPSKLKDSPLFRAARGLSPQKSKRVQRLRYVGWRRDAEGEFALFECKRCEHEERVAHADLGKALHKAPPCPHCNGGNQ